MQEIAPGVFEFGNPGTPDTTPPISIEKVRLALQIAGMTEAEIDAVMAQAATL
jgi:hypothetical protein